MLFKDVSLCWRKWGSVLSSGEENECTDYVFVQKKRLLIVYILLDHKPFTQHSNIVYIGMVLFASDSCPFCLPILCVPKCFIAMRCDQELSEPRICVCVCAKKHVKFIQVFISFFLSYLCY